MEIGLKWVHMARYGLILKLEKALWLRIIFKPLLTPKGAIKDPNKLQKSLKVRAKPAKWKDFQFKSTVTACTCTLGSNSSQTTFAAAIQ